MLPDSYRRDRKNSDRLKFSQEDPFGLVCFLPRLGGEVFNFFLKKESSASDQEMASGIKSPGEALEDILAHEPYKAAAL